MTIVHRKIKPASDRKKGKGIKKNVATLEEHNPRRSICKIKDLRLARLGFLDSYMANSFHYMRRDLYSITKLSKIPTVTESPIFQYKTEPTAPRNMSIRQWDKAFDALRKIMKQNLLINNTLV